MKCLVHILDGVSNSPLTFSLFILRPFFSLSILISPLFIPKGQTLSSTVASILRSVQSIRCSVDQITARFYLIFSYLLFIILYSSLWGLTLLMCSLKTIPHWNIQLIRVSKIKCRKRLWNVVVKPHSNVVVKPHSIVRDQYFKLSVTC